MSEKSPFLKRRKFLQFRSSFNDAVNKAYSAYDEYTKVYVYFFRFETRSTGSAIDNGGLEVEVEPVEEEWTVGIVFIKSETMNGRCEDQRQHLPDRRSFIPNLVGPESERFRLNLRPTLVRRGVRTDGLDVRVRPGVDPVNYRSVSL